MTGHDPLKAGISRNFVDAMGFLKGWGRAADQGSVVGSCRQLNCGGLLKALPRYESDNKIVWHEAECMNCGHLVAAPNGRTLARSSRRDEMPDGWWERRMNDLKRLKEIGKDEAA